MPMQPYVWTDEGKKQFRRLNEQGLSAPEIAERMGRQEKYVFNVRSRLGLSTKPPNPWTEEKIEELRKLAADNSASEIGKILGFSRNAIIGKAHRLALRLNIKYNQGEANRARTGIRPKTYKPRKERRVTAHNGVHGTRLFEFVDVSADLPSSVADKPCNLIDLPANGCRWPCEGEGFNAIFCGGDKVDGHSYCPRHCRMAYRP